METWFYRVTLRWFSHSHYICTVYHVLQKGLAAQLAAPALELNTNFVCSYFIYWTGTDDLSIDGAYKPAYKKLTENAYFDNNKVASDGTIQKAEIVNNSDVDESDKPLSDEKLGSECHHLTTKEWRGRDSSYLNP